MFRRSAISLALALAACLAAHAAATEPIVLVRGTLTAARQPGEAAGVDGYFAVVASALRSAGIAFAELTDQQVAAGKLAGAAVAILPYNAVLSDDEVAALERFVAAGGRLIVCYSSHPRVLRLLGVKRTGWEQDPTRRQFAAIALVETAAYGPLAPAVVRQDSWNATVVEPLADGEAKVAARWQTDAGVQTKLAAATESPAGFYVAHVLTDADPAGKSRLLAAWVGRLHPPSLREAVVASLEQVGRVDRHAGLAALREAMADRPASLRMLDDAQAEVRRIGQAAVTADAAALGRLLLAAWRARDLAERAFLSSLPSKAGEFRGAWIHTAYGIGNRGWDRTVKALAAGGCSDLFANLCWGGVAAYRSKVLAVDPQVGGRGDQVRLALAACRKYGVRLHVWKVNFCCPPHRVGQEFLDRMAKEGRLQVDARGRTVDWLNPAHPANRQLEIDAMVELATAYGVDGIHFDYIRYPDAGSDFSDVSRKAFEADTGRTVADWPADCRVGPLATAYSDWRAQQIDAVVRGVRERLAAAKSTVKVSAAVFSNYPNCVRWQGQDWVRWAREGWVDFLCPMDYTTDDRALSEMIRRQVQVIGGKVPLYAGLGAFRLPDAAAVARQIGLARRAGADGFVLFQLDDRLAEHVLPLLRLGTLSEAPASRPW